MEINYDNSANKTLVPWLIGRYDSELEDEDNNAMVLEDTYVLVKATHLKPNNQRLKPGPS